MSYADLRRIDEASLIFDGTPGIFDFDVVHTDDGGDFLIACTRVRVKAYHPRTRRLVEGDEENVAFWVQNPDHLHLIGNAFNVPYKFASSVSSELLKTILEERARNVDLSQQNYRWVVLNADAVKESTVLSYGEVQKPYIPFSAVGEHLKNALSMTLDGELSHYGSGTILARAREIEPTHIRDNETVIPGVRVQMSPAMTINPLITPYIHWPKYNAGITLFEGRDHIRVHGYETDEVFARIREVCWSAFREAERMALNMPRLLEHPADGADFLRHALASIDGVPHAVKETVIGKASYHKIRTAYDAVVLAARVAKDIENPERRRSLQGAGGIMAMRHGAGGLNERVVVGRVLEVTTAHALGKNRASTLSATRGVS